MRPALLATALVLAGTAPAIAAAPIDALKAGKLECYRPNVAKHTCQGISSYSFGDTIVSQGQVLIAPSPLLTMSLTTTMTVEGDGLCGKIVKADFDKAELDINGAPAPQQQADSIKAQIWNAAFAPREGKDICTFYTPAPDGGYVTSHTTDGQPDAGIPADPMILIDPKDGYTLAPPG